MKKPMSTEEKEKFDNAMKMIYGSNRPANKENDVEKELDDIGKEVEGLKEDVAEIREHDKEFESTVEDELDHIGAEIDDTQENLREIMQEVEEIKERVETPTIQQLAEKKEQEIEEQQQIETSEEEITEQSDEEQEVEEESSEEQQKQGPKSIEEESQKEEPKIIEKLQKEVKKPIFISEPADNKPIVSSSPHIKDTITVENIMWLVVLALLPAAAAAIYFFKIPAILIILISVISAVSTEFIIIKLTKKDIPKMDGSAVITGLLLALILPPTVPLWIPAMGAAFAIGIGKMIFGGLSHNIFNPALVGRAFLAVSFPAIMARWISPDGVTAATPLAMLKLEGIKSSYSQLFYGNIGGCIGETSAIALLLGAAFLIFKKIIDWRIPTAYIGATILLALVFRQDPIFHILAGGLLIGAFFMATDYVTRPVTKNGRLIFGFGCGLLTMLIRFFGSYPEGVMFSILLMNGATPLIDRFTMPKPFG
ncbi:MAG: RnfABCDGE type electron transport complex subunit D, partial [Nanoarchaeota archaeon]